MANPATMGRPLRRLRLLGLLHGRLAHSRRVEVLARHLARLIPIGHSVLDVGCGDAQIDVLLTKARPDLTIAGVDVSVRTNGRIPFAAFDGRRLPFQDRAWDTVLLCDVLHHTEEPLQLLVEATRVARHRIVLKDHVLTGIGARTVLSLMDYIGNAPHDVPLPCNYLTQAQWKATLDACGLRVSEVQTDLGLYPGWADWIFGRNLHFVGSYTVLPRADA